jgi:SAM-dependent methyltransferase
MVGPAVRPCEHESYSSHHHAIGEGEPAGLPPVLFVEYVATPQDVVDGMLELAQLTRDDVLYDLGCGDGRILVAAATDYGCRAKGYDLDPLRVEEARANARRHGVGDRVTVQLRDIFEVDLREATVVTLYLGTEMNARLLPALRQLRPGARIVSHDFGLGGIPPDRVVKIISREDHRLHTIYRWTCPLQSPPGPARPG